MDNSCLRLILLLNQMMKDQSRNFSEYTDFAFEVTNPDLKQYKK